MPGLSSSFFRSAIILGIFSVTACGTVDSVLPDRSVDYRQSRSIEKLEVPPDLTSSTIDDALVVPEINPASTAAYSDYSRERAPAGNLSGQQVLPGASGVSLQRAGQARWLLINAEPQAVWPRVRDFWSQNGFLLKREEPAIGIMETDWAENRADIPQGPVRRAIGKALDFLYSSPTRDSFRVRIEQGTEAGSTELYLTHRGMEEVVLGSPDQDQGTTWQHRPADPELEAEMLKRLMVHLGVEEQRAAATVSGAASAGEGSRLVSDAAGQQSLEVMADFARAWRRVGLALDRSGFAVEDRNREQGLYYVRYNDPESGSASKGVLSGLAFWRSEDKTSGSTWRVQVSGQGGSSVVTVLDAEGSRDNSDTARRILSLLHEQMS